MCNVNIAPNSIKGSNYLSVAVKTLVKGVEWSEAWKTLAACFSFLNVLNMPSNAHEKAKAMLCVGLCVLLLPLRIARRPIDFWTTFTSETLTASQCGSFDEWETWGNLQQCKFCTLYSRQHIKLCFLKGTNTAWGLYNDELLHHGNKSH